MALQEGAFVYAFKRHRSTFISSYYLCELLFAKVLRLDYEPRPSTDQFVSCCGLMKQSAMVHIRLDDPQRAAVQFFDSVGGDLHRRAMAGILPKNLRDAIQRSIDHAVQIFWYGIRVDRPDV